MSKLDINIRTNNSKRSNFIKLAEKRTQKALKGIDLIANLSNTYYYEWEPNELSQILEALKDQVHSVEISFKKAIEMKYGEGFKLDK